MMHSPLKGHLITLEGGEGSGKTTLLHELATYLNGKGFEVMTTREPGGTHLGETIRHWLLHPDHTLNICDEAELLLFLAARAQHIREKILPALEVGAIVLCDRFNESTIAYQGAARGLGIDYVKKLCTLVCGAIQPLLTLYLDVSPEVGMGRAKARHREHAPLEDFDRIESEKLPFHYKIKHAFDSLAKAEPLRIYRIDANQTQDLVFKDAVRAVEEFVILPKGHS